MVLVNIHHKKNYWVTKVFLKNKLFCPYRLTSKNYMDFYVENVELGLGSGSAKTVQIWILIRYTA